jgi:hypothetical protein
VRVSVGDIQESPQATTAAMYRPLDVTSVGALTAALVSDPAETIMHIGRHMPVRGRHTKFIGLTILCVLV